MRLCVSRNADMMWIVGAVIGRPQVARGHGRPMAAPTPPWDVFCNLGNIVKPSDFPTFRRFQNTPWGHFVGAGFHPRPFARQSGARAVLYIVGDAHPGVPAIKFVPASEMGGTPGCASPTKTLHDRCGCAVRYRYWRAEGAASYTAVVHCGTTAAMPHMTGVHP